MAPIVLHVASMLCCAFRGIFLAFLATTKLILNFFQNMFETPCSSCANFFLKFFCFGFCLYLLTVPPKIEFFSSTPEEIWLFCFLVLLALSAECKYMYRCAHNAIIKSSAAEKIKPGVFIFRKPFLNPIFLYFLKPVRCQKLMQKSNKISLKRGLK